MSFSMIFERKLVMGHRLYEGLSKKCQVPHGHNEIIRVEIKANQEKNLNQKDNMIVPFEKVKKTWHEFIDEHLDHSLQLSIKDPLINYFKEKEKHILERVVLLPGDPSTEVLCACLMAKLDCFLAETNADLYCYKIEIQETLTNRISLTGKKNYETHLPPDSKRLFWWNQANFSINNFDDRFHA